MAEILRKIIGKDSFYAVWKIKESVEELLSLISLREDEEKLYSSFVAEIRQKQWLAYRILIRNLLKPAEFPVDYDPLGKPFLAGSDYHISVTHTEDLAGVIISKKGKVGIDLELIKPRIVKVKEKFLNSDELAQIKQGRELEQMTLVWSAKEALYKFYGKRQLDFRENIFVEVPDFAGMRFEGKIVFEGHEEKHLLYSEMIGNCVLVYVVE